MNRKTVTQLTIKTYAITAITLAATILNPSSFEQWFTLALLYLLASFSLIGTCLTFNSVKPPKQINGKKYTTKNAFLFYWLGWLHLVFSLFFLLALIPYFLAADEVSVSFHIPFWVILGTSNGLLMLHKHTAVIIKDDGIYAISPLHSSLIKWDEIKSITTKNSVTTVRKNFTVKMPLTIEVENIDPVALDNIPKELFRNTSQH